jgi:protocatechuate 3,4-dioxygenase beta subunit
VSRLVFAAFLSATLAVAQQPEGSASLRGRVSDANGRPLRKAGLTLRTALQSQPSPQRVYTAETGADGKFSFDGIEPGSYTLSAELTGYLRQSYRAGPHERFSNITLAAGPYPREFDLVLQRAAAISGRVLDADNDPVAHATVHLLRRTYESGANLQFQGSASTDESGNYNIPDLSPGEYYLSAGAYGAGRAFLVLGMQMVSDPALGPTAQPGRPPDYYADTYYPRGTDQREAKAIQVRHEDVRGADIHLLKAGAFSIKGKLVGTVPGHSLEQCRLILMPVNVPLVVNPMAQGITALIAKDGSFDFSGSRFPSGEYFIATFVPPRQVVLAPQRIEIRDRDIDNAVLNIQSLVEVHGSLSLEGEQRTDFSRFPGNPPPSVTMHVSLVTVNGPAAFSADSGVTNDGAFTIAGVAPGAYEVRTSGIPGGAWLKSIQFDSRPVAGSEIEVTGASGATRLEITMSRAAGQIEGVVETEKGEPAAGSTIILVSDPPGKSSMTSGVGKNGEFTLPPVAPGTYRLYAWEDIEAAQRYDPALMKAYEGKSLAVRVEANGRERVKLTEIPASETEK